MKKKLLILDIDETLIYATEKTLERKADFRVGHYFVYKRPHLKEFLSQCLDWFEVAVWTSSSPDYAKEILANIFDDVSVLSFVWASDRCTYLVLRQRITGILLAKSFEESKAKRLRFESSHCN